MNERVVPPPGGPGRRLTPQQFVALVRTLLAEFDRRLDEAVRQETMIREHLRQYRRLTIANLIVWTVNALLLSAYLIWRIATG